ncbi:MAG: hypothetical protein QOD39_4141 [Mycobacterium sp.]|nr:hypothetical protein [Mycobacterium sp.]
MIRMGAPRTVGLGWAAFGVLIVATVAERALTLWHPDFPDDGTFDYAAVSAIRNTWWAFHFFGGIAVVMQAVAFAVAVCLLARTRGSAWAIGGATIYILGAAAFGVGIAAEGVAFAYAADPAAVPAAEGARLLSFMGEHAKLYTVGVLPGLALSTVGTVGLCAALLRAGTIHRIIPIVLLVGTLAAVVLEFGIIGFAFSTVAVTVPMLAIGWFAARAR